MHPRTIAILVASILAVSVVLRIVIQRAGPNGTPIHIKDLGHVVDSAETQTAVVRIDGSRGVFMRVNKQPGANTIAVVDQVRELLPKVTGVPLVNCALHAAPQSIPAGPLATVPTPGAIEEVVLRCLAKDPARRFESVEVLSRAFSADTRTTGVSSRRRTSDIQAIWRS